MTLHLKKWQVVVAILTIAVLIGMPVFLWIKAQNNQEYQQLMASFAARHGTTATIMQQPIKQTAVYTVVWKDAEKVHVSSLIAGIWVEIYSEPLPEEKK